jgi:glycosyltransferase involved in cell wall biosynthesis
VKSVHITNHWHASSGGVRTWYRSLLEAADRFRRPIRVVVPGPRDAVEDVGRFGRIYTLRSIVTAPADRRYRLLLPHRYLLPRGAVVRVLRDEQPDLVEVCDKLTLNWLAGLIRKRWLPGIGRPAIVGLSCERLDDTVTAYVSSAPAARRAAALYCRWAYLPLFDAHLAVSDYVARELREAMHPLHRRPVKIVSPGVDIRTFANGRRREALRRTLTAPGAGRAVLLLYAGRLSAEKNLGLLVQMLDVLSRTPGDTRYVLLVAGAGPLEAWLKSEAVRFPPGQLRVLEHVAGPSELADLYASCDVFVHPNPREPFGLGPLEAMAAGAAVVVPDAGGVLAYASDLNAWTASPTAESFAQAVRAAAQGADRARRIEAGREVAARFSAARAVVRALQLYDSLRAAFVEERITPEAPAEATPAPSTI